MSSRKRHEGNRFNPNPTDVVGVFGLSLYTSEKDLKEIFGRYGELKHVNIVYDHLTGRSRGFGFVYFEDTDDAADAKEQCNGLELDGRRIRVDYSITKRAHTPTPGVYMGRPTKPRDDDRVDDRYDDRGYDRDYGRSGPSNPYYDY
jgi:transformer-2 protein